MKDNQGDIFSFLDQSVYLDLKVVRGRVERALDVAAVPILVANIDDAVVFVQKLVALDYDSKILA